MTDIDKAMVQELVTLGIISEDGSELTQLTEKLIYLGILDSTTIRDSHVGESDYSDHVIQPWSIWCEYNLNGWDADIVKRVLRTKSSEDRMLDYEKIQHICDERIRQLGYGE